MRVYVAGPISAYEAGAPSSGQIAENVRIATLAATEILRAGHTPFLPHLSVVWLMIAGSIEYEHWLGYDFNWIEVCDVLLRLPGASSGSDREVEHARKLGIPVYYSVEEFLEAAT